MKSSEYWAKREAEALKHRITDEKEYERQIKKIYAEMIDNCQKEINSFYVKYANAEGISLAEAKKRVSKLDIAAYERKAARYVKDKDFSKQANEEMRLYNATMKINRLEMLKANLGLELISGHNELEKFMGGILQGRTEDELARQAGILGKTIKNPAENAKSIVNASFHNANFSNRIWLYQDVMKADLERLLKTGIIQGRNPNVLARELTKRFDVGRANAERLMRTELARVQTEAQKQSFERNGFTEYEFIVNGGCCDICAAINGKHFKVKDMLPGENAAPLHPNCRCSIAAYEDTTEFDAWLDHLGGGGTMAWEDFKAQPKEKLTNNVKSDIINTKKINLSTPATSQLQNIGNTNIKLASKQIGHKIGRHAKDYGLDPANPEHRNKIIKHINDIIKSSDEIKQGDWRGQSDPVDFYIKGEDVVVVNSRTKEFITLLKGGINNERVKNARKRKI